MGATGRGSSEMDVPCPLCSYSGAPSSVEAHISSKTDEAHKGKQGREFRDELVGPGAGTVGVEVEDVEESSSGGDVEEGGSAEVEDPSADGGPHSEGSDTADGDAPSERDEAIVAGATAGATMLPAFVAEMDTKQVALAALVVVLLFALYASGGSEESAQESTQAASEEREEDAVSEPGGVI